MVEHELPKLGTRVRFPSSAPVYFLNGLEALLGNAQKRGNYPGTPSEIKAEALLFSVVPFLFDFRKS